MELATQMERIGVVPVLVIDRVADARRVADVLADAGCRVLEITLRTEAALDAIAALADHPSVTVGAGTVLDEQQLKAFGWRIPFLASAALVLVGLYVRLTITETPVFQEAMTREERARVPIAEVFRSHWRTVVTGVLSSLVTFVLFYLMTVFALSWGTTALGHSRTDFLVSQLIGVVFFAVTIPISAKVAEHGRRRTLIWVTVAIGAFGFAFAPMFASGFEGATAAMIVGLSLMGLTYGPLGTVLSELFPTRIRYTGSSMTFNLTGIFGASLAPYLATWLAREYGLHYVGYYLVGASALTLAGLLSIHETRDTAL